MIAIPAIDLRRGQVVRLFHGDFKEEKVYRDKPASAAKAFEVDGAQRIHVVDLDGALDGTPKNLKSVEEIVHSVRVPIQMGGGIRDLKMAALYLEMGVRWVVLGTRACLDKGFAKEALAEFKDRVIIGIDALNGFVATHGWTKVTKLKAVELALEMQGLGAKTVIYTDIAKDGALQGPNLSEIQSMGEALQMQVIASGGVSSLKDIENLLKLAKPNLIGVIIGKALYEKQFSLKEAVSRCSQKE